MSLKRSLPAEDEDGIIDLEPTVKRARLTQINEAIASPSKKRRLEEDGLILMEGAHDRLDDDVIEID